MEIYEMLNEIESEDNKSYYGVEPLSYVALSCGDKQQKTVNKADKKYTDTGQGSPKRN